MDKIICVGKNYLEHAKELGDAIPEKPVVFLKPPSVLKQVSNWGDTLLAQFPYQDNAVQPECELVFRVAKDLYQLKNRPDWSVFSHVSVGLDMTLRTHQTALKKQGHPWTTAKVFLDAALIGPWEALNISELQNFTLQINQQTTQVGNCDDMMMHPLDLMVYISQFFPIKSGDILFTGTPSGVSSIQASDQLQVFLGKNSFKVDFSG